MVKFLHPRFVLALFRAILIKVRYRSAIKFNLLRTYFSPGVKVEILNGGKIEIDSSKDRVFFSRGGTIICSGGEIRIDSGVFFNENFTIVSHVNIRISTNCMFGPNICLFDSDHAFTKPDIPFRYQGYIKKEILIGENVWLGAGSVVTKGSIIGCNTVIGANTVVRGQLDDNSVYAGNPIRFIRKIE